MTHVFYIVPKKAKKELVWNLDDQSMIQNNDPYGGKSESGHVYIMVR